MDLTEMKNEALLSIRGELQRALESKKEVVVLCYIPYNGVHQISGIPSLVGDTLVLDTLSMDGEKITETMSLKHIRRVSVFD